MHKIIVKTCIIISSSPAKSGRLIAPFICCKFLYSRALPMAVSIHQKMLQFFTTLVESCHSEDIVAISPPLPP